MDNSISFDMGRTSTDASLINREMHGEAREAELPPGGRSAKGGAALGGRTASSV